MLSLVEWSLVAVVSVKYLTFVLRADRDGEGGIMALIGLVATAKLRRPRIRVLLVIARLFGAALFYGDGIITPSISVLSAVEGLNVASPSLAQAVVPISLAVLVALFALQRFGTGIVGGLFGPVMTGWFAVLAAAGVGQIVNDPGVLKALSPTSGCRSLRLTPGSRSSRWPRSCSW